MIRHPTPTLKRLRWVSAALAYAVVMLGVVAAVLVYAVGLEPVEGAGLGTVVGAIAAWGLASQIAARFLVSRPLECSSPRALANSYAQRFILRMALSESAAMAGFVGVILTTELLPYLIGAAFALVGFALCAPTDARVAADQEILAGSGCVLSLAEVLEVPHHPVR